MLQPLISVIVAEKNSARTIRQCLNSLLGLTYPRFEIIVVDDGSTDETGRILSEYSGKIRLIRLNSGQGPSSARNAAASQAKGDFIAFTDGDCVVDSSWLGELAAGFDSTDAVSVGGTQAVPEDESPFGRAVSRFFGRVGFAIDYMRSAEGGLREVEHNASCNSIYRKEVFMREGGFSAGLWPGEDVELDYRLRRKGYRILFNPKAVVKHYRPSGFKAFCRMMLRYGWAQGVLARRYGLMRKLQFLPVLSLLFLVFFLFKPVQALTVSFIMLIAALIASFDIAFVGLFLSGLIYWNIGFASGFLKKFDLNNNARFMRSAQ